MNKLFRTLRTVVALALVGVIVWNIGWMIYDVLMWEHAPSTHLVIQFTVATGLLAGLAVASKVKLKTSKQPFQQWPQQPTVDPPQRLPIAWEVGPLEPIPPLAPPAWKPTTPKLERRKLHIPGLRTAKRILAVSLLAVNFFISQGTLLSSPATQPMFWLFILNSFILLDYLWKTRR